jgi:MFS superfamily sulfate permease-like transporter
VSVADGRGTLGADVRAGLVVCLVAIPLCLGIALASGAPLHSGLVTGVIGGIVVSLVGRTPLLVSGPAAGLAAIVLAAITELGSFEAFLAAVVVAGVAQLAMGLARAGRLAALVPSSVITGMLAAIGVLLVLQQFPNMVGAPPERGHGFELLLIPINALSHVSPGPALAALLAFTVLVSWEYVPAHIRKVLPGPLVAVVGATLAAQSFGLFGLVIGESHRVNLPDLSGGLGGVLIAPDFSALAHGATWKVAFTLAVVASLETLLSLEATDRMDPLKRRSNPDRELLAQGVGNLLSGLVGGLPMTGVIVRSAANVSAGAVTWRSSLTHGLALGASVMAAPWLLELIPLSVLAAVLVHTGWKLAHPTRFTSAFRIGWGQLLPLATTVVVVVATDLLIGVATGLAVSLLVTLATDARHGVEVVHDSADDGGQRVRVRLAEAVSFVHKPSLHQALEAVPVGAHLTVDGSGTRAFDHDVIELLHGYAATARDRGIHYSLVGVPTPSATASH